MSSSVVAGCVTVGGSSTSSTASAVSVGGSMSTAGGSSGLFVDVGMLLIEGRVAEAGTPRGYKEGPHCPHITNSPTHHTCQDTSFLCERASKLRRHMSLLNENSAPMCIDVLLCPDCPCGQARANSTNICQIPSPADLLIEQWTVSVVNSKSVCITGNISPGSSNSSGCPGEVPDRVLLQALRSQLHFSQLSAWYSLGKVKHVCYRLSHPVGCSGFTRPPVQHNFPLTKISPNSSIKICLKSLPRTDVMPIVSCPVHSGQSTLNATVTVFKSVFAELGQCLLDPPARIPAVRHGFTMWRDSKASSPTRRQRQSPPLSSKINDCSTHTPGVLDDRLLSGCKHIGKHHCEDDNECLGGSGDERVQRHKPYHHHHHHYHHHHNHQLSPPPSHQFSSSSGNPKEASCSKYNSFDLREPRALNVFNVYRCETYNNPADFSDDTLKLQQNDKQFDNNHSNNGCSSSNQSSSNGSSGSGTSKAELLLSALIARGNKVNPLKRKWATSATATSSEGSSKKLVSSAATKATELAEYFTKLDISHHDDTLPPPPSPPPLPPLPTPNPPLAIPQRKSHFLGTDSSSEETEGESPINNINKHKVHGQHSVLSSSAVSGRLLSSPLHRPVIHHSRPLLGSFEENILSGRLPPVCKVDGFTADLGASGNFCPQHLKLPVSVSFFSVEPHSAPYLGEINLGKKGYTVPRSGTIQLTLLNPLGTVIKMFVVGYDVTDMPANSHTFIRQRTVSTEPPHANKLRYLIHLRLRSSKSGRISLMSDIQVILSRQYDVDSSVGLDFESGCLKSITITPSSPRYSANK